jgi:hypothetical protein
MGESSERFRCGFQVVEEMLFRPDNRAVFIRAFECHFLYKV